MSILVVTAPAARRGLTTVAVVKREFGITGSADHDFPEDPIPQASVTIEGWCRRALTREEVTETFRLLTEPAVLHLARWPNLALVSIVEDGVTLAADDWELDAETGELWRLDGADRRVAWQAAKIVLAYAAGYLLPGDPQRDLPEDLVAPAWNPSRPAGSPACAIPWSRASRSRASAPPTTGYDRRAPAIPACPLG